MSLESTPSASEDARLVAESRGGSLEAFEHLVRRHQNLVCAVAYSKTGDRRLSEDVAQETFLAAWKQRDSIREPDRIQAWLCSTARNLASKARRAGRRERPAEVEALERDVEHEPSPLDAVIDREDEATVWDALEELPETYREPLVLFYRENQSIREVAAGLGLTEDAAKKRLSRGRQALREGVEDSVGRTLEAGRPRAVFTAGVLALLGSVAVPQSAAAAPAAAPSGAAGGTSKFLWFGLSAAGLIALVLAVVMVGGESPEPEAPAVTPAESASADGDLLAALHERRRAASSEHAADSCQLHGVVFGEGDDPLADAWVTVRVPSAGELDPGAIQVRDDGTWSLGPVPAGDHSISVTAAGHLPSTQLGRCGEDSEPVIETRLSPGGTPLRGSIADLSGGSVAEATVWLIPSISPSDGAFSTRSDDDGVYELSARPDRYTVLVLHPDYVIDGRMVIVAGDAAEESFRLLPAANVEGIVVDPRGEPVSGAMISSQLSWVGMTQQTSPFAVMFGSLLPVRSGEDGRFRIGGLGSGEVKIHASTSDLATLEPVSTHLAMAESKSGVTIELADAFEVSGFVVDEGDPTQGLADVRVALRPDGALRAARFATTDDSGYFAVRGLSPARYRALVGGRSVAARQIERVLELSDKDIDDILVRVHKGVEVRGRVRPPGRVALRLEPTDEDDLTRRTLASMARVEVSDSGEFTFPSVADGSYRIVAATLEAEGRTSITVDGESMNDLVVEMTPLSTLEGRVLDEAGEPVAGAQVAAALGSDPVSAALPVYARTDREGRFELLGLQDSSYSISVVGDYGARAWAGEEGSTAFEPRTIDIARQEGPVELTVATGTTTVRGQVVDRSGVPLEDARVQLRSLHEGAAGFLRPPAIVLTDEEGEFAFEELFGDSFVVEAVGPRGQQRAGRTITDGTEPLPLRVSAISSLVGTVERDAESVEDFEVHVSGGPSTVASFMIRKRDGAFEVPDLIAGEYEVTVRAGDRYARQTVEVGPAPRTRAEFELLPAPRLQGRVVDDNGDPDPGSEFAIFPHDASFFDPSFEYDQNPVQADGTFEIGKMYAGRWTVLIRAAGADAKSMSFVEFELKPGQVLDLGMIVPGERIPLSDAPFLDHSPNLGLRFFVGPSPPDAQALSEVDDADDPRSVIDTQDARLWIATVDDDSPAERAGFAPGDIVSAVGRTKVGVDRPPLEAMISLSQGWRSRGRPVDWVVERGTERLTISVLVPRPGQD